MEMPEAIAKAFSEGDEVVIESFLAGREITCGLYLDNEGVHALPLTEIISHNDYFDYEAKYEGKSNEVTPAEVSEEWKKIIQDLSKNVFRRLGLNGFARIDYMVSEAGEPYLIEVNTNPGMSPESIVPQMIEADGKSMKEVLSSILAAV